MITTIFTLSEAMGIKPDQFIIFTTFLHANIKTYTFSARKIFRIKETHNLGVELKPPRQSVRRSFLRPG